MPEDRDEGDYEIGYKKPPKHTRWPKGTSGNSRGRKKGARSLKVDLDAALKETHSVKIAGKIYKGSTQALALLLLAKRAASGDVKATAQLVGLTMTVFGSGERGSEQNRMTQVEQELFDQIVGELGLAKPRGGDNQQLDPKPPAAPQPGLKQLQNADLPAQEPSSE